MSGPTTVGITSDPLLTLLSASAIEAAMAIRDAYRESEALRAMHAEEGREREAALRHAAQQGREKLAALRMQVETRLANLGRLAERLGLGERMAAGLAIAPPEGDPAAEARHIEALSAHCDRLTPLLLDEAERQSLTPDQALADIQTAAPHSPPASDVERVLQRASAVGPLPDDLLQLARQIDATDSAERAAMLTATLRQRVQAHVESTRQQAVQQATATVVAHTLQELGYQVEAIAETLFVEGGVVHFRRSGWGDYQVRMRVNAAAGSANFNVVRAVDAGDNERSVLDHIAEDRWCAEFPALLKALERQGVHLHVKRRLAAGELPVQLVARDQLPRFADDEASAPAQQANLRQMP